MTQRYLIVNTEREEYLDPAAFGEHETFLGWGGFAGNPNGAMMAVAILLQQQEADSSTAPGIRGSWISEPIVFAVSGSPRGKHIPARTAARISELESPATGKGNTLWFAPFATAPNLYAATRQFYTDISVPCIQVLCTDPYTLKALVQRGCEEALRIAKASTS